jgi:hypothetical protein
MSALTMNGSRSRAAARYDAQQLLHLACDRLRRAEERGGDAEYASASAEVLRRALAFGKAAWEEHQ